MAGTLGDEAAPLVGRDREQDLLTSTLDDVTRRGQALVLRGEPGIGKSRLLSVAQRTARERGFSVLGTTGVQSEAHLPFAGLHQLLCPVRARLAELPAIHRAALEAAFGLTLEVPPGHYRIAMAALDLVSDIATDAPVLLVIEDAQWLDRPTSDVLAFVARRIESDPVVLLAAARDGYPSVLVDAGLPELRISGLDDTTAEALLDAAAPELPLAARTRVLREAGGNPLALLELPAVAVGHEAQDWMSGAWPLTERLERAFAGRVSDLPDPTRLVLLVAALNDEESVSEILRAGSVVAGSALDLDVLGPAAGVGIVDLDLQKLRFRHPLIRSAVAQSASLADRRRVHEALAHVVEDRDRRAWHRAALLTGEHEDVARELELAGEQALRRGALAVAVTAMRRAAELGEPARRSRRLLDAAVVAVELGRPDAVAPLLRELNELDLGELERARVTWIEEMAMTRPRLDASADRVVDRRRGTSRGHRGSRAACRSAVAGGHPRLVGRSRCRRPERSSSTPLISWEMPPPRIRGSSPSTLTRIPWVMPPRSWPACKRSPKTDGSTPMRPSFFGPAALVVGAFDLGHDFLAVAVDGLRTQGRLGQLPRLLMLYSTMAARMGDWEVAIAAADEARRLAEELGQRQWGAPADTAISLVAAIRGDDEKAEQMATRAEMVAEPAGANITMAFAQFGRVLAALASSRHAEAFAFAERLFDPDDSAYHPVISSWLIADLAEAARHTDRLEVARARVAQVEAMAGARPGTWVALALGHARALVAEPTEAGARFDEVLASDLTRWPFRAGPDPAGLRPMAQTGTTRRRIAWRLAGGPGHLRRPGLCPLERVCATRAAGVRRAEPPSRAGGAEQLTPQELQIAQLAAEGLSNRQIGQRLYLSHRTISTHLYKVFPKLGITSRYELSDAPLPRPLVASPIHGGQTGTTYT